MQEEVKNILESSMHDIVIDAIKEVDIRGIMIKQIESVTESIARDMFSSYGDFQKELKEKLRKEISFNIDTISVPEFGKLAIDTVQAEISKIENEEKEKLQKSLTVRLATLLGTKSNSLILKDLTDVFIMNVYEEHIKYKIEDACTEHSISCANDVQELIEYYTDHEFNFILQERSRNWGADWKSYNVVLILEYKYKNKTQYEITLNVDRERDDEQKETYLDDDTWRSTSKNLYKVKDLYINGRSVLSEGTIYLKGLREEVEQILGGCLLNETLINANELYLFEIDND